MPMNLKEGDRYVINHDEGLTTIDFDSHKIACSGRGGRRGIGQAEGAAGTGRNSSGDQIRSRSSRLGRADGSGAAKDRGLGSCCERNELQQRRLQGKQLLLRLEPSTGTVAAEAWLRQREEETEERPPMERKETNLPTMCSGRAMQKSTPAAAKATVTLPCASEVEGRYTVVGLTLRRKETSRAIAPAKQRRETTKRMVARITGPQRVSTDRRENLHQ
ncbi:hypothetical protein BHE74_00050286 [Ensete ventricosum]|nr:hypothetical protein BHE74_00050286 [Ensete ventricosum]